VLSSDLIATTVHRKVHCNNPQLSLSAALLDGHRAEQYVADPTIATD